MSSDRLAERRRELEHRLARLSAEGRAAFDKSLAQGANDPPAAEATRTIPPRDPAAPVPMSYGQELLWLLERTNPGHAYNVPRMVRLRGPLHLAALRQALDALVARHEPLRTTFSLIGDQARQLVNPPTPVVIREIDLTGLPIDERDPEARRQLRDFVREPFDLAIDLQLRASVVRLGDDDHVLALVSHHVASDGWSGNIVLRELAALYDGYQSGAPAALPALPIQYADFAAWQRETLSGQRLENLVTYWREHLAGAAGILELPVDYRRPAVQGFDGDLRSATGAPTIVAGLRALAQEEGATTFMALLAVCYVLIHRYTDETEIVVGTPVAGRDFPELDGIVGFFTNTLLLRASLAEAPTFRTFLRQVRDVSLAAHDHQQVPLEVLLLDKQSSGGVVSPQIMFMTEDPGRQPFHLPGTESTRFGASRGATKFDLTLHVASGDDGPRISAEFRTDLFDPRTIDRLLRHYLVLLESAVTTPDAPITSLPILDDSERTLVLEGWNQTDGPVDASATIHGLVEAQVARTPGATALECGDESLTFAELDFRAMRFAAHLQRIGVARESLVGVCLPRSLDLVVAVLGILKAGGCYLPLDPEYPPERLALIVHDSGVHVIVADDVSQQVLPQEAARFVDVHAGDEAAGPLRPMDVAPANLAYVIYTSGSTGRPKGVEIEHRSVVNFLIGSRVALPIDTNSVLVAITPLSFDISVLELFHPLVSGGRVVIAPATAASDPDLLANLLVRTGATHLQATPSTWRLLVESKWSGQTGLVALSGGESLPQTLAAALLERGVNLWNLYGPTEATIWATLQQVTSADLPIPIGRPMRNVRAYVLDAALQPVPIGIPGELYLGGQGLARGYRDRPELTAERFPLDPFAPGSGARMYRTGDRAKWRPDGTLECLGRTDFQVKLRGHRIELGEIENVLARQPEVSQAVAMVREDSPGDQRLVAYVVRRAPLLPDPADLRARVRDLLPAVMVPAAIVVIDQLPLTPNGKVDRKALGVPTDDVRAVLDDYVAPRVSVEAEVAELWSAMLGVKQIGVHDDFFDLGGNSLMAMRMIAEIERIWGRRIPFQALLATPTVENVASVLMSAMRSDTDERGAVVLQEGGPGTPLAFVHGDILGYGWYTRRLAALLGESPLIVLPTLGPRTGAVASIESMASTHIAALRAIQAEGPYRIGGFCSGGMIAYEMARQLADVGQVVDRVIMVDAFCSNLRVRAMEPLVRLLTRARTAEAQLQRRAEIYFSIQYAFQRVRQVRQMPASEKLQWFANLIRRKLGLRATSPSREADIIQDDDVEVADSDLATVLSESRAVFQFVARAQRGYLPASYRGRIDVIWAADALARRPWLSAGGGWEKVAAELHAHTIAGNHLSIVTQNGLPALADAIRKCLS